MERYLSNFSEPLVQELRIVQQKDHEVPLMLHISMDTQLKSLVPRIGARQMASEDRTMPRVCCAPTLYGCILGYQCLVDDYVHQVQPSEVTPDGQTSPNKQVSKWRNGYKIYHIPYEYGVLPSNKLVPDVDQTDETWLVNYSPETRQYVPVEAGHFFAGEITIMNRTGKKPIAITTLFIEVKIPQGLHFSKNHFLHPGYWRVEGKTVDYQTWMATSWKNDDNFHIVPLTADEFYAQKRAHADMLSLEEKPPVWAGW